MGHPDWWWYALLGGHFFLFAFHAHEFEFALLGFDGGGDLLLDGGCRLLELGESWTLR